MSDPKLYEFIPQAPPTSADALRERFVRLERRRPPGGGPERWLNWVVRVRADGTAAGLVEVTVRPQERLALLAYFVLRAYWRRGIAREACAAVLAYVEAAHAVDRVVVEVDARNAASLALAGSLGFAEAERGPGEDGGEEVTLVRPASLDRPG